MTSRFSSPETLDENYNILSRTTWAPDDTTTIIWKRGGEGKYAFGTFPSVKHAYQFLNQHLNQGHQSGRPSAFHSKGPVEQTPQSDQSVSEIFDDARNDNDQTNSLWMVEVEGPITVPIKLSDLDTAVLRGIIDSEPENHNTIAQNDEKYKMLNQIQWSGVCTKKIEWRREGQNAVGTFGFCEDASGFIFGYLSNNIVDGHGFLLMETEDSLEHRGRVKETFLLKRSRADDIQMPERQPWGVPVEVTIPLAFLDANGLRDRLTLYTVKTNIVPDAVQLSLPGKGAEPA